jgi:hypothetical protein
MLPSQNSIRFARRQQLFTHPAILRTARVGRECAAFESFNSVPLLDILRNVPTLSADNIETIIARLISALAFLEKEKIYLNNVSLETS